LPMIFVTLPVTAQTLLFQYNWESSAPMP